MTTNGERTTRTGTDVLATLLAEYAELKAEQRARISFRDNFIYVTLGAVGAVGWGAIERNIPHLLLLIPLASLTLGWTYLRNDVQIAEIRTYIRNTLKPRVTRVTGDSDIFGWEFERNDDRLRSGRKWTQLFVNLAVFVLPSAVVCVLLGQPQTAERYGFGPGTHVLVSLAIATTAIMAAHFCICANVPLPKLRRGGESR